jgi:integrase
LVWRNRGGHRTPKTTRLRHMLCSRSASRHLRHPVGSPHPARRAGAAVLRTAGVKRFGMLTATRRRCPAPTMASESVGGQGMLTSAAGSTRKGSRVRSTRNCGSTNNGLPEGFTFHDLRHYLASLLIASGADIKPCRRGCGTPPRAPRWTPTGICGRTPTSPRARPSRR